MRDSFQRWGTGFVCGEPQFKPQHCLFPNSTWNNTDPQKLEAAPPCAAPCGPKTKNAHYFFLLPTQKKI